MTTLQRTGLISRVADCCFWLGRYVERSESSARVLQVTVNLGLDGELSPRQVWQPPVIVAGEEPAFLARFGEAGFEDGELVQRYLVWDEACAVALRRSIAAARENARSVREVISIEAWEAINELHLWIGSTEAEWQWSGQRDAFYRHARRATQLALGLMRSTMLHDTALDFIWLGVLLERVGQTARLLDVHHHALAGRAHDVVATTVWLSLLRACSGYEPFMKSHAGRVSGAAIAAFLMGEARFPRSVAYCVRSAYDRLCAIRPAVDRDLPGGEALERLASLDAWMTSRAVGQELSVLHDQLTHVVDETAAICETIGRELFA